MIRYIHGSADSTDLDVVYVVDELPSFAECQAFCRADRTENRNIIAVRDGVVTQCFKGLADEVNNAVLTTWALHPQEHPLVITRAVPRDVFLKDVVATRKVISPLTETHLRPQIKAALRASWPERLAMLQSLRLEEIDLTHVRRWRQEDLLKSMAFQIGMALGLHQGVELYTKADIAARYPALAPYLARRATGLAGLQETLTTYVQALSSVDTVTLPDGTTQLTATGARYDIFRELRLE